MEVEVEEAIGDIVEAVTQEPTPSVEHIIAEMEVEEMIGDTVNAVTQEPALPVESINGTMKEIDEVDVVLQESTFINEAQAEEVPVKEPTSDVVTLGPTPLSQINVDVEMSGGATQELPPTQSGQENVEEVDPEVDVVPQELASTAGQ